MQSCEGCWAVDSGVDKKDTIPHSCMPMRNFYAMLHAEWMSIIVTGHDDVVCMCGQ